MRKYLLLLCSIAIAHISLAQQDPLPPYLKEPKIIPPFTMLLADSSTFTKAGLPKKRPVVITYFDPECGHCQQEAAELSKHLHLFPKVFFVMATFKDLDLVRDFIEAYQLDAAPNIRVGREPSWFLPVYFQVKTTPFTAVYDRKGRFLKAFEHGYTIAQLQQLLD